MHFLTVIFALVAVNGVCGSASATPMLYKKNTNDKYEAELIPVSSTVIPLSVYEVSYGSGSGSTKVKHAEEGEEDPDTLITIKKKLHYRNKAKVKSI